MFETVAQQMVPLDEVMKEVEKVLKQKITQLAKYDYTQTIVFLNSDGLTGTKVEFCKTTSFTRTSVSFMLPFDSLLYVFPEPDSIRFSATDSVIRYYFPQGGYTYIQNIDLHNRVTMRNDTFVFKTSDKNYSQGYYGIALLRPEGFNLFSYAWFVPDDIELLYYTCNRAGKWMAKSNMIQFIAKPSQNNLLFEIAYKRKRLVPQVLENRKVNYTQEISLKHSEITIRVADNVRADGDIVSLNLNGNWILRGYEVSPQSIKLKVGLSTPQNYLILYADNEGSIPPNTATIEINDGTSNHKIELRASSNYCEGIMLKLNQ